MSAGPNLDLSNLNCPLCGHSLNLDQLSEDLFLIHCLRCPNEITFPFKVLDADRAKDLFLQIFNHPSIKEICRMKRSLKNLQCEVSRV